ncbi:MAG: DUF421 domain-containing protein [Clostridiales bacterium]|nr:DUF421 domain-containing protein [Clostridiales bacterium]
MPYLTTALTALLSIAALFALTKLMGCRQVSQLSMFDYINGITIGSIAAELATARGEDFWRWLIALVVYALVTLLLSVATDKSIHLQGWITGRPLVLLQNGRLNAANFRKCRLDVSEFLTQCRIGGWFDLDGLDTVLMEANGSLSFLPKEGQRPATPADLGQAPDQTTLPLSVLQDGQVLSGNLRAAGHDEPWLDRALTGRQLGRSDVFLAYIGQSGALRIFPRE